VYYHYITERTERYEIFTCNFTKLWAESDGVVGLKVRVASEEGGLASLVICIGVGVRAIALEIIIELNSGRGASLRRVVAPRAAVGRVGLVSVEIRKASGLAANRETGGVERALQRCWAVWSQVHRAIGDRASFIICDSHGQISAIHIGDIVEVFEAITFERKLCEGSRRYSLYPVRIIPNHEAERNKQDQCEDHTKDHRYNRQ